MTPELTHTVHALRDKKAEEIVVLDLHGRCDFTDYFVICHGTSDRQVVAIADAVEERLRKEVGISPGHVEGRRSGDWVLLDYFDFVVHVFMQDKRSFYGLDRLWGDAPSLELPPPTDGPETEAPQPPAAL